MTCLPEPRPEERLERALRVAAGDSAEMSLVELVLFACETSEDEAEIDDLVGAMIRSRRARLLPWDADPFLHRLQD